jgi:hypothetical protein
LVGFEILLLQEFHTGSKLNQLVHNILDIFEGGIVQFLKVLQDHIDTLGVVQAEGDVQYCDLLFNGFAVLFFGHSIEILQLVQEDRINLFKLLEHIFQLHGVVNQIFI